ncbi:MAG: protein-L-isoaspartate(D-aspartate) O-methyltransferase [Anaerolineae bacterium]
MARRSTLAVVAAALVIVGSGVACGPSQPVATQTPASSGERPAPTTVVTPTQQGSFVSERLRMVEQQIASRGVRDAAVLRAMQTVPRHRFVPQELSDQAYADHPLLIGYGQTISQPYIVALMTEKLALGPGDKVLEIGTGSGYQAAVLAEITDQVYSVEIIPQLAQQAAEVLRDTGYTTVQTLSADGYYGWEEHAPYDAIVVTAAPDHVPRPLIQQLKDGGRLVIPIGPPGSYQTLWQITKHGDKLETRNLGGVLFVPFRGAGVGR